MEFGTKPLTLVQQNNREGKGFLWAFGHYNKKKLRCTTIHYRSMSENAGQQIL